MRKIEKLYEVGDSIIEPNIIKKDENRTNYTIMVDRILYEVIFNLIKNDNKTFLLRIDFNQKGKDYDELSYMNHQYKLLGNIVGLLKKFTEEQLNLGNNVILTGMLIEAAYDEQKDIDKNRRIRLYQNYIFKVFEKINIEVIFKTGTKRIEDQMSDILIIEFEAIKLSKFNHLNYTKFNH
jgi:hypothetical protein